MKYFATLFTAILGILAFSVSASAQRYEPTDKWPYVNQTFLQGNVRTSSGALVRSAELNVCLSNGSLHYINDGKIMQIDMNTIYTASIGNAVFLNAAGRMMKVLAEGDGVCVLELRSIDVEELGKVNIGYGISSATASSENVNILNEMSSDMVNMSLTNALRDAESGKRLPLLIEKYIWVNGMAIRASKSDIANAPGVNKSELNAFVKQNKIKWNDVPSLLKVAEFLSK